MYETDYLVERERGRCMVKDAIVFLLMLSGGSLYTKYVNAKELEETAERLTNLVMSIVDAVLFVKNHGESEWIDYVQVIAEMRSRIILEFLKVIRR